MNFRTEYIASIQKLEREKYAELKVLVNDYEVVDVGSSSSNEKRVDLMMSDAKVVPRMKSEGTYELTVDGRELVVVRIDKNDGWEENLQVTVYENGEEIDAKIAEIEELAQMRMSLYKQLSRMNASTTRIDAMETELDYARKQLKSMYAASNDDIRQAQINTYYYKQYQAYTSVLQVAIVFTVLLIGVALLYRSEFLSDRLLQPMLWLFIALAIIVFGSMLRDLSKRDSMDYDAYESSTYASTSSAKEENTRAPTPSASSMCKGPDCCADGQRYDYIRHVCEEIL